MMINQIIIMKPNKYEDEFNALLIEDWYEPAVMIDS